MSPILLLLIFFLTTFIPQSLGDNEQVNKYLDCFYPFECGNFTANYPFWGAHRPQSCGHPLLELRCEDHKRPIILLGGVKYKIHHINEKSKILKISRADYQDGFCNPQLQNTTLLSPILNYYNYSETEMIIFFYNCPSVSDQSTASSEPSSPLESTEKAMVQFNCSDKHGLIMKNNSHVPQDCLSNLAVPVNKSFISQWLDDLSLLQRGLREGFEVKWNDSGQECEKCKKFNNGSCAYDLENSKMVCYCLDDQSGLVTTACPASQESPAPSGTKKRVMLKWIGIGIATGFVAAVSLGVISILIMRRCKRKKEEQFMDEDWETQPTITKTTTTLTKYYSKSSPGYCSSRSNNGKRRSYFGAQVFNHFELEEATNSFDSSNELGGGGFGTVYHGVLKDGQEVAIKRLYEHSSKRVQQFLTEIQILARLSHPNLAKLYGCTSRRSRELLLVYEYIPNGTLGDHLHGRNSNLEFLTWSTRLSIAIDAADALAYLHASNVIHRDVKTSNMLLNEKLHVKVVDFGLSRLFPNDVSHISTAPQGTPGYVDPDYYHCYKLTDKSDVYSFGVVLVELISSLPAVDTNRIKHDINLSSMAITRIQNHELDEIVDPDLGFETDYKVRKMIMLVAELAFRCLQQEKEFRPSMQEVAEVLREIQNNETNGNIKAEKVGSCDTHDKVVLLNNGSSSSSHDSTRRSF